MPRKMGKRNKRKNSRIRKALVIDQAFLFYTWWSPEHLREAVQNLNKSLILREGIRKKLAQ